MKDELNFSKEEVTQHITTPNKDLDILKQHFAHCFDKNGAFDFDKFKQSLAEKEVLFSKESYSMDWLGKSYARLLATDEATTLLRENKIHNQLPENTNSENLLLKGDNLEVLKHLSNAYYEKIKMIYIDPPYNTGSDGFVYQDDRKFTTKELQRLAGVSEERAKKILAFTNSKSNSHSAWLTFMYPRLYIAKQLLKDDGVIFISIDDNEVAQLRILMDEVFGEENCVGEVPVVMNLKGNQDSFGFAETHEYFLVYAKNKEKSEINEFNIEEEELTSKWEQDDYGLYKIADNLRATGENAPKNKRPNLWYPIFLNETTKFFYVTNNNKPLNKTDITILPINPDGEELSWYWGKTTFNNKKHNLILNKTKNGWQFYRKQRPKLGDIPTKKPKSFFYKSDYSTSTATTQLKKIFNKKIFKGPKPLPFITDLIKIGSNSTDLILDFFAGSGTTGDAVMQLNAKDGGNRKFILVQLPEPIDKKKNKAAYDFVTNELKAEPTIFEITKERLIRAAKKVKAEAENNQDLFSKKQAMDLGFKIFETEPIWEDYRIEAEEFNPQMELFDESKLTTTDLETLRTTWKTYDGMLLTQSLLSVDLDGYLAHYFEDKLYLMSKGFETKNLTALIQKIDNDADFSPSSIIVFGYHFDSKHLREISENVKSYTNKKSIDIDVIVRY